MFFWIVLILVQILLLLDDWEIVFHYLDIDFTLLNLLLTLSNQFSLLWQHFNYHIFWQFPKIVFRICQSSILQVNTAENYVNKAEKMLNRSENSELLKGCQNLPQLMSKTVKYWVSKMLKKMSKSTPQNHIKCNWCQTCEIVEKDKKLKTMSLKPKTKSKLPEAISNWYKSTVKENLGVRKTNRSFLFKIFLWRLSLDLPCHQQLQKD